MLTKSEAVHSKTFSTVLNFIQSVNNQSITQIVLSLSEETIFCNSQGKEIRGKDNVLRAWMKYFELFPDYYIDAEHILEKEGVVLITGHSGGTYKNLKDDDCRWRLPSAWKVQLENEQIILWQVYTDNMVPFDIIKRNMSKGS